MAACYSSLANFRSILIMHRRIGEAEWLPDQQASSLTGTIPISKASSSNENGGNAQLHILQRASVFMILMPIWCFTGILRDL